MLRGLFITNLEIEDQEMKIILWSHITSKMYSQIFNQVWLILAIFKM